MVADALSRQYTLLNVLDVQYLGFDHINEIYKDDLDFSLNYQKCSKGGHKDFFIHDGFLFKGFRDDVIPIAKKRMILDILRNQLELDNS